jgi:hypothetical protein
MTAPTEPGTDEGYLIDGRLVTMPVQVRAARQAAATFLVDHAAAKRVIATSGLNPTRYPGGRSVVSLALVDYTDNDLDAYKELALAVLVDDPPGVEPGPKGTVSSLIWRLPVTEQFTCSAGRQIWGFPKWVADLDVDFHPGGVTGVLRDESGEILRIEMRRGRVPLPRRKMPMAAYSCDDELVVRRTPWVADGTGRMAVRPGGTRVTLGYGHPMADELRALGFPKRALMTLFDDHLQATFQEPVVV